MLSSLPQIFSSLWRLFSEILYLLDGKRLNGEDLGAGGHRIASLDRQRSSVEYSGGKD